MQIKIMSRSKAKKASFHPNKYKDFHVISLTDIDSKPAYFSTGVKSFTAFKFNDEDDSGAIGAPTKNDVMLIVDCFVKTKSFDNFIVHCEAGICRSSATAIALYCYRQGYVDLDSILQFFTEYIGWIMPNMLLAEYFDDILEFNGQLIEVCNKINEIGLTERGYL